MVVLITGPARGIGEDLARQLRTRGHQLALVGREPDRLERLARELGDCAWFHCDVTQQDALDAAVRATVEQFGRIDVVVANAGIASNGTVAVTPVDALVRVLEVNLIGVVRTVSATLPHIIASRGYYMLLSSAAAIVPPPAMSTYNASKAGVEQFGNTLRTELRHKGVDVGVAHPSWIDTDLVRDTRSDLASFDSALRRLPGPFGRVTSVEDCCSAIADAIERRKRKVFVPRSLAPLAAFRQFFTSPVAEWLLRRPHRELVMQLETEVPKLGRSFGANSAELTSGDRTPAHSTADPSSRTRQPHPSP